jgi:hypothetical protein
MRIFYSVFLVLLLSLHANSQDKIPNYPGREASARVVKFYPNPAISYITFEFRAVSEKPVNFQIYNFLGKKVYEVNHLNPKTVVDLSDFYRGVYIFQLRDASGRVVDSGKFQVSK